MTYQKCPICNGSGIFSGSGTFNEVPNCPTCKGMRIINSVTGLPPKEEGTFVKVLHNREYQDYLYELTRQQNENIESKFGR